MLDRIASLLNKRFDHLEIIRSLDDLLNTSTSIPQLSLLEQLFGNTEKVLAWHKAQVCKIDEKLAFEKKKEKKNNG
jgi:hypothetical protein